MDANKSWRILGWIVLPLIVLAVSAGCTKSGNKGDETRRLAVEMMQGFSEYYSKGDMDGWLAFWAGDAKRTTPTGVQQGAAEIRAAYETLREGFPELNAVGSVGAVQGNLAVWEGTISGTHAASGRPVSIPIAIFMEFNSEGKAQKVRGYFDVAGLMKQVKGE